MRGKYDCVQPPYAICPKFIYYTYTINPMLKRYYRLILSVMYTWSWRNMWRVPHLKKLILIFSKYSVLMLIVGSVFYDINIVRCQISFYHNTLGVHWRHHNSLTYISRRLLANRGNSAQCPFLSDHLNYITYSEHAVFKIRTTRQRSFDNLTSCLRTQR